MTVEAYDNAPGSYRSEVFGPTRRSGFDSRLICCQASRAARIIEPTSQLDALLEEAGIEAPSYRTLTRRQPSFGGQSWRRRA